MEAEVSCEDSLRHIAKKTKSGQNPVEKAYTLKKVTSFENSQAKCLGQCVHIWWANPIGIRYQLGMACIDSWKDFPAFPMSFIQPDRQLLPTQQHTSGEECEWFLF